MKHFSINYGKHFIDDDDINAVVDVLRNKNLTQGQEVEAFEQDVAKFVGSKYSVAVSSWTAGLHLAYIASGIDKNNGILTSPITFAATANAAHFLGSFAKFVDIDPITGNISPDQIEDYLKKNNDIKTIVPVHFAGMTCAMKEISYIAEKYGINIVEDAAHALGAKNHDGSMVGNCASSLMAGFSFHPVKSIATGEGGMITTNDKKIYQRLLKLRSHGINRTESLMLTKEAFDQDGTFNDWYYEVQEIGFNYRLTDIQCALGRSQLIKLKKFIDRRNCLVKAYDQAFTGSEFLEIVQLDGRDMSSHHLYPVLIDFTRSSLTRRSFMKLLSEKGINTQVHYIPVHFHPFYKNLGFEIGQFPEAEKFYESQLSLPLYYSLSDLEQEHIIHTIYDIFNEYFG